MSFDEILAQVIALLQQEGRVSYRGLKIRFNLDDEYLEGLKDEIIEAKQLAADERGKVLVWTGDPVRSAPPETPDSGLLAPGPQLPAPLATRQSIWLSVFAPSKRRWKHVLPLRANAKL